MKRSWMPAALMGTLSVGYLAGSVGREPTHVQVVAAPISQPAGAPTAGPSAVPTPVPIPVPPVAPTPMPPVAPLPQPVPNPAAPTELEPIEPFFPIAPVKRTLAPYPAWNGVDLNCPDVGHPVRIVNGYDPHGLDRDGDGIGCDG